MAIYYNQEDVLNIIKNYDDCDELLADLLELDTYTKDGEPAKENNINNITNLNFICDKEKIENIINTIIEKNNGEIMGFKIGVDNYKQFI